jgi:hypothetical protein
LLHSRLDGVVVGVVVVSCRSIEIVADAPTVNTITPTVPTLTLSRLKTPWRSPKYNPGMYLIGYRAKY